MMEKEFHECPSHMAIVMNNKIMKDNIKKYGMHIKVMGHAIGWTPDEIANHVEDDIKPKHPEINTIFHFEVLSNDKGFVDSLKIAWYGERYFPSQKKQKALQCE